MADPLSDLWLSLTSNYLCLLGGLAFLTLLILLFVILRIKKIHRESRWAYNPDKTLKLRWRRG